MLRYYEPSKHAVKLFCVLLALNILPVSTSRGNECRDHEQKAIIFELENGELRTEVERLKKEILNLREANAEFHNCSATCSNSGTIAIESRGELNGAPQVTRDGEATKENLRVSTDQDALAKSLNTFMQEMEDFQSNIKEKLNLVLSSVLPTNCAEAAKGKIGVFSISVPRSTLDPFPVSCDVHGWTIVLQRMDGSVDFNRSWFDYKSGFGNTKTEFFLGLEKLYQLTSNDCHELKFVLQDFENNEKHAKYDRFQIGSELEKYALTALGSYSGTAGDDFSYYKGNKFTTFDQDNDERKNGNCALERNGGWWWHLCGFSKLTGLYIAEGYDPQRQGINWWGWKDVYSYKVAKMMIRKKSC